MSIMASCSSFGDDIKTPPNSPEKTNIELADSQKETPDHEMLSPEEIPTYDELSAKKKQ